MSAERTCGICTNVYGGKVVPTLLICCLKHVCFNCAESDRNVKISQLVGNRKAIKCMFCNQLFHSSKETPWKVNKPLIELSGIEVDMSAVKEAQSAMTMMQVTPSPKRSSRSSSRRAMQEVTEDNGEDVEDDEEVANSNAVVSVPIDSLASRQQHSSISTEMNSHHLHQNVQENEAAGRDDESRFSAGADPENGEQNEDSESSNGNNATDTPIVHETRARKRARI